jgi:hypothetical protein
VSLDQLKVMSAIERCRTAALGGHVARCENAACGHTEISYNSCLMGNFRNGELATRCIGGRVRHPASKNLHKLAVALTDRECRYLTIIKSLNVWRASGLLRKLKHFRQRSFNPVHCRALRLPRIGWHNGD